MSPASHHGCPMCERDQDSKQSRIVVPRTLAQHGINLRKFSQSDPALTGGSETQAARNLRCRESKCINDEPLLPFVYDKIAPPGLHVYLGMGRQYMEMLDKELSGGQSHDDFLFLVEKYTVTPSNINSASK